MLLFKLLTLVAAILAAAWAINRPGYDSITAAVTAFAALVGVVFIERKRKLPNQSQTVGAGGKGIQIGGDSNNNTFN
jgi:FtsH-binding integral membrane protein